MLLRNFICSHAADRPEGGFGIVGGWAVVAALTLGSHTETRWHTRQVKVGESWREERYSETVTIQDFAFTVDASPPRGNSANLHVWTLANGEPALRGTHHFSYGGAGEDKFSRVAASSAEGKAWAERVEEHREFGNAPWLLEARVHKFSADEIGDTGKGIPLQQWCEAFCADKAKYKRFVLVKEVWGWDFKATKRRACASEKRHSRRRHNQHHPQLGLRRRPERMVRLYPEEPDRAAQLAPRARHARVVAVLDVLDLCVVLREGVAAAR